MTVPVSLARLVPAPLAAWAVARLFTTTRRAQVRPAEQRVLDVARRFEVRALSPLITYAWGDADAPAIVLVHGWNGHAGQMTPFVAPLCARGFRVVAFDGPAHGASPGRVTTAVHMGHAVAQVVDAVGGAEAVIAHSLGVLATGIAATKGLALDRVAFVAPASEVEPHADVLIRSLGLLPAAANRARAAILARAGAGDWSVLRLARAIAHLPPPLIVHDEQDRYIPIGPVAELVERWPGADLVRTGGLGHGRILTDARVVERIVDHVASRPLRLAV